MRAAEHQRLTELGEGIVRQDGSAFTLTLPAATAAIYHDAQISDYDTPSPQFTNKPPLRLSLHARATGDLRGTAGFGFWNHAFVPGQRRFRLPQAIWFFFASPPNDIALAQGIAGFGWKAATFNARNWRFYALLPLAPLGFLMMRNPALYRTLWSRGQRALGVSETLLDPALLHDWHHYTIDWHPDRAAFSVDGTVVLSVPHVPRNPLGFIAWIDNQYAVVTPQGNFRWGTLDIPAPQSLHLRDLQVSPLA